MPITAILGSFTTFKHALISWEGALWTNRRESCTSAIRKFHYIPSNSVNFGLQTAEISLLQILTHCHKPTLWRHLHLLGANTFGVIWAIDSEKVFFKLRRSPIYCPKSPQTDAITSHYLTHLLKISISFIAISAFSRWSPQRKSSKLCHKFGSWQYTPETWCSLLLQRGEQKLPIFEWYYDDT